MMGSRRSSAVCFFEQSLILDDQLAALERDSRRHGTDGDNIDFALLVDGLEAEREQGITIDVAYRYVSTPRRSFIIADTPGHEQYTRNMATGASGADLAILLVDARKGLLTQTCRHAAIVSLTGIRHVVLAVNKIDLTGFDAAGFEKIVADFKSFAATLTSRRSCRFRYRRVTATIFQKRAPIRLGTTARRCSIISRPSMSAEDRGRPAVPLCCPMGQSPASRLSRIFRNHRERNRAARR